MRLAAKQLTYDYSLAETPWVLKELNGWIRRRLRAVQLSHWKHGRRIYRELIGLGLRPLQAAQVASGAGQWWSNSKKMIRHALPNRLYEEMGLPSLLA